MFTKFLFFLALPFVVVAQYNYGPTTSPAASPSTSTAPASAPSAPASTANQFNVDVAFQGTLTFNPNNMSVPVGSLVTFYFPSSGPAHSVTQSSFSSPCTYLAANGSASAGFDSGLVNSATFTINITDTSPIWFFCKHALHCGLGMVGSINAPTTGNTFANFRAAAVAIGSSEPTLSDSGPVTGGLHGVATAGPTSDVGAAATTTKSSATKVIGGSAAFLSAILAAIFMA